MAASANLKMKPKSKPKHRAEPTVAKPAAESKVSAFSIVGIGASAGGGFEALEQFLRHVPGLLAERKANPVLRAWVPGCSTGEEAYSLAIPVTGRSNRWGGDHVLRHHQIKNPGSKAAKRKGLTHGRPRLGKPSEER